VIVDSTAAGANVSRDSEAGEDSWRGAPSAVRARNEVKLAATLLERQDTERALRLLSRAMKGLPTLDDSITALYHVSEGLFQRAERSQSALPKQRACGILKNLRGARTHPYAASISYLYRQECQ
jgi:hypothetical protein